MLLDFPTDTRVTVSGQSLPRDEFRMTEAIREPDEHALIGLLEGKMPAHHVRRAIDPGDCHLLGENFRSNPGLKRRSKDVPADCVGADHDGNEWENYLDATEQARPHLDALFRNTDNPAALTKLITQVALAKFHPATLRAAEYDGKKAADARAMIWRSNDKFTYATHNDSGQGEHSLSQGFEIQQVTTPVVVRLYASVPRFGGGLRIWNLKPEAPCRARYGVGHTAYHYPPDQFKKIESVLIKVEAGDIVFLNGSFCHAEEKGMCGERLLVTYCMGFTDDETVVWWT